MLVVKSEKGRFCQIQANAKMQDIYQHFAITQGLNKTYDRLRIDLSGDNKGKITDAETNREKRRYSRRCISREKRMEEKGVRFMRKGH